MMACGCVLREIPGGRVLAWAPGEGIQWEVTEPCRMHEDYHRSALAAHPEDRCQRCGRLNVPSWYAPSPLWNEVMGGEGGIVCPVCFAALAEATGVAANRTWVFALSPVPEEGR